MCKPSRDQYQLRKPLGATMFLSVAVSAVTIVAISHWHQGDFETFNGTFPPLRRQLR